MQFSLMASKVWCVEPQLTLIVRKISKLWGHECELTVFRLMDKFFIYSIYFANILFEELHVKHIKYCGEVRLEPW